MDSTIRNWGSLREFISNAVHRRPLWCLPTAFQYCISDYFLNRVLILHHPGKYDLGKRSHLVGFEPLFFRFQKYAAITSLDAT